VVFKIEAEIPAWQHEYGKRIVSVVGIIRAEGKKMGSLHVETGRQNLRKRQSAVASSEKGKGHESTQINYEKLYAARSRCANRRPRVLNQHNDRIAGVCKQGANRRLTEPGETRVGRAYKASGGKLGSWMTGDRAAGTQLVKKKGHLTDS